METETNFFLTADEWARVYLGAKAGILIVEAIENNGGSEEIEKRRMEVENKVREQFGGFSRDQLNGIPIIESYNAYYKNFEKSYHVRAQVESIAKGKSLPNIFPLLTAMFTAEINSMLLTAGHDLDALELPVEINIGKGGETYTGINGSIKTVEKNDMMMSDRDGIISSIINGPDARTKITPATTAVLFAVYAPASVEAKVIAAHLEDIRNNIRAFSPDAKTTLMKVYEAH
jgi:DNA/RNA-binding domain of Phe-tRNA-synthetase-like protein